MKSWPLRLTTTFAFTGVLGSNLATAADARLQLELPATGASPYVAVWLERSVDQSFVGNLAVWYETSKRGNRGTRWLPELRQWWRKSGGVTSLAADGVTGATRSAGTHTINLAQSRAIKELPPGAYEVVVEVVREHGGYDVVRLPMTWPATVQKQAAGQGRQELGAVRLTTVP